MLLLDRTAALEHLIHEVQPMNKAVDISNWSDVPTDAQVRCLLQQGYVRAIVGSSFGTVAAAQMAAFELDGIEVHEYQFPLATKATKRLWWLDAENDSATVDTLRAICKWALPPTGIYTRRSWWLDHTNDWNIVAEFPWLKLWDASYRYPTLKNGGDPRNATEPPLDFVPYGGFTSRAMHQYADSLSVCNLNCDLNIIEEEQRMYSDADIDAKLNDLKGAVQGTFGLALRTAQSDSQIGRALADHIQKTGTTNDAATIAALQQRMDENDARLTNIGKILAP